MSPNDNDGKILAILGWPNNPKTFTYLMKLQKLAHKAKFFRMADGKEGMAG